MSNTANVSNHALSTRDAGRKRVQRQYSFVVYDPARRLIYPAAVNDRGATIFGSKEACGFARVFEAVLSSLGIRDQFVEAMEAYQASCLTLEGVHERLAELEDDSHAVIGSQTLALDLLAQMVHRSPNPFAEYQPRGVPFAGRVTVLQQSQRSTWSGSSISIGTSASNHSIRVVPAPRRQRFKEGLLIDYAPGERGIAWPPINPIRESVLAKTCHEIASGFHRVIEQGGYLKPLSRAISPYYAKYIRFEVMCPKLSEFWEMKGAIERANAAIKDVLVQCDRAWSFPIGPAVGEITDDKSQVLGWIRLSVFLGSATWDSTTVALDGGLWHPRRVRDKRDRNQETDVRGGKLPGRDSLATVDALTEKLIPKVSDIDLAALLDAIRHANELEPERREHFVAKVNRLLPCLGHSLEAQVGGTWTAVHELAVHRGSVQYTVTGGKYGLNNPIRFA